MSLKKLISKRTLVVIIIITLVIGSVVSFTDMKVARVAPANAPMISLLIFKQRETVERDFPVGNPMGVRFSAPCPLKGREWGELHGHPFRSYMKKVYYEFHVPYWRGSEGRRTCVTEHRILPMGLAGNFLVIFAASGALLVSRNHWKSRENKK